MSDPNRICSHEFRTHPVGSGIFVCFECFVKLVMPAPPTQLVNPRKFPETDRRTPKRGKDRRKK